ncbi:MAG: MATE family efflux transporter [Lachnospiraceae bacterium]|nr:MATE family efflux transporter [Lachnospiraceae bacterium]
MKVDRTKTGGQAGAVDLMHGPIMKNLLIFMLPSLVSYICQQLYKAVDTAIVGHYLGEQSLAAVGANVAIFDLMVMFAQSLGNGLCIVVSRAYGAGDEEKLRKSVAGSLVIGVATTLVMTVLSLFGLGPLLRALGTPEAIYAEALSYIRIIGGWIVVMFAYNLFSSLLRAIGNSAMSLVFLIISSVLNVILDLALVAGAGMGVRGAAAATVIAQGISAVLCVGYILARARILIPNREDWNCGKALMAELAGQGYAMAFMGSVVNVGSVILQSGINSLGATVIAGHTTARKLFMLCALPNISMGMAISTFVSQNKGAGQRERIIRGVWESYVYDLVCGLFTIVVLFLFADELAVLISGSTNPELIGNTVAYVRFAAVFSGVLGVLHQTRLALQGLGAKFTPLVSSFIELFGKCIFAWSLVPRMGYRAVILCEPLIWCVMAVHLVFAFFTNPYIRGRSPE